jgi:hypothetical protein
MDDGEMTDRRLRWQRQIRRAYRIPDLVLADNARAVVVGDFLTKLYLTDPPDIPITDLTVESLLESLIECGAAGKLDSYLVPGKYRQFLGHSEEQLHEVVQGAKEMPALGGNPANTQTARRVCLELEAMLELVGSSSAELPFEDGLGQLVGAGGSRVL